MSQNSVKEFCLGEEDFQWLALNLPCSNSFSYYFKDNIGGATIWTNFIYTYPRTICVQYLRILFCGFGKEDFAFGLFVTEYLCSNCFWLLFR